MSTRSVPFWPQHVTRSMYWRDLLNERIQGRALDAVLVFLAALFAVWIRHSSGLFPSSPTPWSLYLTPSLLAALAVVLALDRRSARRAARSRRAEIIEIAKAVAAAIVVMLAISFFFRDASYSRATVILFFLIAVPALMSRRFASRHLTQLLRMNRKSGRRVVVVGFGHVGRLIGEEILNEPAYYTLVGFVDDDRALSSHLPTAPILGTTEDLPAIIEAEDIDEVILAIPSAPKVRVQELIGTCITSQVRWQVVPNVADLCFERIEMDLIGGLPIFAPRGSQIVGISWALKRAFDLVAAAAIVIVTSPLLLAVAILIKTTSKGPVLYRQTRVGLNGRQFTMFKFRSMRIDGSPSIHQQYTARWILGTTGQDGAGRNHEESQERSTNAMVRMDETLPVGSSNGSSAHKITDDPRVTRVGRFIRATSLDEMPQLLNVLRGEMSLVGPRPPIPYEVERYTTWHRRRLDVLPGITGLWQVSGRNRLTFEEMVDLDVRYIEEWSLGKDLEIVWKTIPSLLTDRGY